MVWPQETRVLLRSVAQDFAVLLTLARAAKRDADVLDTSVWATRSRWDDQDPYPNTDPNPRGCVENSDAIRLVPSHLAQPLPPRLPPRAPALVPPPPRVARGAWCVKRAVPWLGGSAGVC